MPQPSISREPGMGHWDISTVSKDDPNTIVICRDHSAVEVHFSSLFLSVNESRAQWQPDGCTRLGDQSRPLEIQITTGTGQTAVVFIHRSATNDRLVVHGHIEGARHVYGWRELTKGKPFGTMTRKLRIHVGADGTLAVLPDTKFTFLLSTEDSEQELPKLEFKIPMFAKPPSYEASTA
ncbi:hypothetical protein M406DRAFT_75557 [Cryphonectria parasitica EP155]|uniref:Uncharacterized protein n=1 Tax=Cryphonectria parasitica (strain ATCC 38755 / EP155) TaxID=660469 RepID=A0A9P5CHR7_CRYP1|nr:uncharacterized protein M406DRAFT_75557 [Cryphonectria parasitica EP155]KAF3760279.1 hypothetical protein M406DRAFT_75557 [Cryphonectria parasitica EP155]